MNKTLIALLISSVVLAGCGKSDSEIAAEKAAYAANLEQIAQQNAKQQQEADELELAGVIAELKKGDPLIKDAYYGYNEKGDRVLHVVRDNPVQPQAPQQQYAQQGANGQPVIINNQPAQQAASGVSESVWPLLAGAGAGMLLAQAMNSGGGYNSYQQSHRPYSNNYYNDNDYRRERSTTVNNYRTTVVQQTRSQVRSNPTAYQSQFRSQPTAKPVVRTNNAASFNQNQYKPQAQKPASNAWGGSGSSFAGSKPKTTTSSGWGTSSSSSSASRSSSSGFSSKPSTPSRSSFSSSGSSRSSFSSSRSSSRR